MVIKIDDTCRESVGLDSTLLLSSISLKPIQATMSWSQKSFIE